MQQDMVLLFISLGTILLNYLAVKQVPEQKKCNLYIMMMVANVIILFMTFIGIRT